MVIIPIRAPSNADTEKVEWVMLELNGELLKPLNELGRTTSQATPSLPGAGGAANDNKDSIRRRVELGSVKLDANGAPTMIIGNHELKGTAITLKEPFAVLRKRKASQITENDDADGAPAEAKKLKLHSGVQLEVVGVVKKKFMFVSFPKSIMR